MNELQTGFVFFFLKNFKPINMDIPIPIWEMRFL